MKPYVGVNYFSGWWRETPNKWQDSQIPGRDWRQDYVNRIPLNGCYDDQATMDRDILTASQYGIDYFQMLYYPVDSLDTFCDEPHRQHLNNGIRHFCNSPYNHKLRFVVEYCNHPPFAILDASAWLRTCHTFAEWFSHPSYFTIDGRALFKIHGFHFFLEQCGGDRNVMAQRIETLKAVTREVAGKELTVCAGIVGADITAELKEYLDILDFFSVYMDMPLLEPLEQDYAYELLKDYAISCAQKCAELGIAMQPYYPSGWNPRPWHDPRPSFRLPDREQIRQGVTQLRQLIQNESLLGIHSGGRCYDAFTIYAWNEYGEGGYLSPTLIEYDEKLQGLYEALTETEENL